MQAYWDIPMFAEYSKVRAKRADARIVDHQEEDSNNSGNELPLDPELREERQGEGVEVWAPMLGA